MPSTTTAGRRSAGGFRCSRSSASSAAICPARAGRTTPRPDEVCGHKLPAGLIESQQLPEPIFTPATKAETGHDENIDRAAAVELVGEERFDEVEAIAIALYRFVSDYAGQRGIILADTKLEFGLDQEGRLVLGDEAFTPDSSRFWPADEYTPGRTPPSFDKQFVSDYCESLGWNKTAPGPGTAGRTSSRVPARATSKRSSS